MKMAESVTNMAAVFRISTVNLSNIVRRNLVRKRMGGQWNKKGRKKITPIEDIKNNNFKFYIFY